MLGIFCAKLLNAFTKNMARACFIFCFFASMNLPIIIAAGGLVFNENDELLMIFRRGKWDLPKGKLDEGEEIAACALREVMEETGLQNLVLGKLIGVTKHCYFDVYTQKDVEKHSYWYAMKGTKNDKLIPQTAEDISEIGWFSPEKIGENLVNSFDTIKEIIGIYRLS